ncbi:MAG: endolytic transglycosylase MltG [Anaerolineales bacterium]
MSKRRNRTGLTLSIGCIAVLCLGVCLLFGGYLEINRRVEAAFGPPSPQLGSIQRLRLSTELLLQSDQLQRPLNPSGDSETFQIPLGLSPLIIASQLESAGLIPDAGAFINFLTYTGLDTTLQAGEYTLSPASSPIEIAYILQDATPSEVTLSILSGWRMEEIAATLPTSGLEVSPQEFINAAGNQGDLINLPLDFPQNGNLEGFFPPGSYRLPRETTAGQLVSFLVGEFTAHLTPEILDGIQNQGLNVYQAVTLASIVEREAILGEEMPLIASVFLNRLEIGMPLEADSTVQYARGFNPEQNTWWTNPLSSRDLQFDSPYNTYIYPGLTPGPIANPSLRALRAVAFPAQTPYYYFRATCDQSGKHTFSETFEEHLSKGCP